MDRKASCIKVLRSAADLAVNGAPPAFATPIHVGRPNIGDRAQFHALIDEIFDRCWLTNNGPLVQQFEEAVAKYLGVAHCVALCNGTVALEVAIRSLRLEGEVIVPSYTFIATAHALSWVGITPVFADIDPTTHNLDPSSVSERITPRTSGILGVHLWGRPAPVEALTDIAERHGLALGFDGAHAFGCSHRGKMIGGFGRYEMLSFHATKFFNSFEGGALVTNDDALADRMRRLRNFGFTGVDEVSDEGINGKMIEPAAAMGLVNIAAIDSFVAINRRNYAAYQEGLADIAGVKLLNFDTSEHNNFQYVVAEIGADYVPGRDALVATLIAENVRARKYFWPGCHRMQPYRTLNPDAGRHLPNTEEVAGRVVVLPTGTAVGETEIETICDVIKCLGQ